MKSGLVRFIVENPDLSEPTERNFIEFLEFAMMWGRKLNLEGQYNRRRASARAVLGPQNAREWLWSAAAAIAYDEAALRAGQAQKGRE